MVNMLAYSGNPQECEMIYTATKDQVAYLTGEKWNMHVFQKMSEVENFLMERTVLDAVCFDITVKGGVEMLEHIRKQNSKAFIVLIASTRISPIEYIKPTIMASFLLLRPIELKNYNDTIRQLIEVFQQENIADEELFILEDREGKRRIPYQRILCFEAREKKIYVCTETEEYGFYETLEKLGEQLPKYFVRCHRGFIVNTKKISKVVLSENMVYLQGDYLVPFSRSYKNIIKEYR